MLFELRRIETEGRIIVTSGQTAATVSRNGKRCMRTRLYGSRLGCRCKKPEKKAEDLSRKPENKAEENIAIAMNAAAESAVKPQEKAEEPAAPVELKPVAPVEEPEKTGEAPSSGTRYYCTACTASV